MTPLGRRTFLRTTLAATALAGSRGSVEAAVRFLESPVGPPQGDAEKSVIFRTTDPRNAEPALADLVKSWITPNRYFYVRSHAPNPQIDPTAFRLRVEGLVDRPLTLSLGELGERFRESSVVATMTCAGNRRTEHNKVKQVGGVQWEAGAIGNARWNGVVLADVLRHAGLKSEARHVWFEGLDQIPRGDSVIPFGGSIPIEKALDEKATLPGALLATGMNGEPLPADHGYPLRTVVPGYIGARSVKWLGRIVVSDRPSPNHYLATAYKLVQEGSPLEWAESGPIYRYPVNSVICQPAPGTARAGGSVTVAGYALPSGLTGSTIERVELSADNGRTWRPARLTSKTSEFCWSLWSGTISTSADTKQILVRATDSVGRTQPDHVGWNMKGYLYNAWHSVPLS